MPYLRDYSLPVGSTKDQCSGVREAAKDLPSSYARVNLLSKRPRIQFNAVLTHIETNVENRSDSGASSNPKVSRRLAYKVHNVLVCDVDTFWCPSGAYESACEHNSNKNKYDEHYKENYLMCISRSSQNWLWKSHRMRFRRRSREQTARARLSRRPHGWNQRQQACVL